MPNQTFGDERSGETIALRSPLSPLSALSAVSAVLFGVHGIGVVSDVVDDDDGDHVSFFSLAHLSPGTKPNRYLLLPTSPRAD